MYLLSLTLPVPEDVSVYHYLALLSPWPTLYRIDHLIDISPLHASIFVVIRAGELYSGFSVNMAKVILQVLKYSFFFSFFTQRSLLKLHIKGLGEQLHKLVR